MLRALASHQCGPGSNPRVDIICELSLLLVLSFAPRGFFPGTLVFPSSQKPTFSNSSSTMDQIDEEPLCGCATSISLFILFILIINCKKAIHEIRIWISKLKSTLRTDFSQVKSVFGFRVRLQNPKSGFQI